MFTYDELVARDKCSLDIFWLKDESLEDSSKLPDPHVLAAEIAEDLRSRPGADRERPRRTSSSAHEACALETHREYSDV